MNIQEIVPGAIVEIRVRSENKKADFVTHAIAAVAPNKCALMLEPIYIEDKIIDFKGRHFADENFNGEAFTIEALAIQEENGENIPYLFKKAAVAVIRNNEGRFVHLIATEQRGRLMNRRSHYRLFVGSDVKIQIGEDGPEMDAFLKDFCGRGFSIVCNESLKLERGMTITMHYADQAEGASFKMTGMVTRSMPVENQPTTVYGCRVSRENEPVNKYIADKQRKRTKRAEKPEHAASAEEGSVE